MSVEEKVLALEVQNTKYDIGGNQERADATVFLHAGSIVLTSSSPHLPTKTVKTDVLVPINDVELFPNFKLKEFWIELRTGLHRINISIHRIYFWRNELDHFSQQKHISIIPWEHLT